MSLKKNVYDLTIKFTSEVLGSQPGRNDPASKFIRDRTRAEHPEVEVPPEEIESLPVEINKGTTGFFRSRNRKNVVFKSYQIKGMLKEAASQLNGIDNIKNLRSKVESTIFINPVDIPVEGVSVKDIGILERPLRAMTAQGPRVTLARSETIPSGGTLKCRMTVYQLPKFSASESLLRDVLDFSRTLGLGQWRNSNVYGQFDYKLSKLK
jgi:hypothetical protein